MLLWVFVFSVVGVLRGDLYGTRVVNRRPRRRSPGSARPPRLRGPRHAPTPKPKRPRGSRLAQLAHRDRGPLTGTTLPLREAGTLIGRNPECALVLDDDYASAGTPASSDATAAGSSRTSGSTNGTFLGHERLTGHAGRGRQRAADRQDRHRAAER